MTIFDKFLPIEHIQYLTNQIAKENGLNAYGYFYDKNADMQFPGNSNIYQFREFTSYEPWRIRFNLCTPSAIYKRGVLDYVLEHQSLKFNLTIKGYRFLYVVKFSKPSSKTEEEEIVRLYIDDYKTKGQLCFDFI